MEECDDAWVNALVAQTVQIWNDSARGPIGKSRDYGAAEQANCEKAYDEALREVDEDLQRSPDSRLEQVGMQDRVVASFGRFSARALDLEREAIDLLTHEFLPVGTQLAQWARRFDPDLGMADIIQAARNAWTACGLQPLLGASVNLTPSILGYSLLYPYSDNYLDDEAISPEKKLRFSQRFRYRLLGGTLPAADDRERSIWALIALIETQYPRADFPQVFDCLLAIHRAQEQSIGQLHTRPPDADSLRLSCAKGGTSVLADAYLARGSLTSQESRFAFEWGVLLQLGDDLQDVHDDLRRGSVTLFSRAAAAGRLLDELTLQLLSFSEKVAERMEELPHGSAALKKLLKTSWRSLIIRAVADSHEFFSPGFLREAERSSPFRFDFLRRRSERLQSRQGLYAKLFGAFLECPGDCSDPLGVGEPGMLPEARPKENLEPPVSSRGSSDPDASTLPVHCRTRSAAS